MGAEFTQNQKFTIEELKKWRAREPRLEQFLSDIERNPICRRLQLQGILPVEHQRLGTVHPTFLTSVGDPDQEPDSDPKDPHVFGPPGSGSISQRILLFSHKCVERTGIMPAK